MASGVVMILLATTDAESRVTHLRPAYVCFAMSHPYCTWGRVIPVTPILSRREMCCADADGKAIIHKKGGWHVFINGGPGRPWLAASLVGRQVVAPTINRPYRHRRFS